MRLKGDYAFECKPTCPHCGITFDACKAGDQEGKQPSVGDFTVCVYCGKFAVFGDNMQIRQLTSAEMIELEQLQGGFLKAMGEEQAQEYAREYLQREKR